MYLKAVSNASLHPRHTPTPRAKGNSPPDNRLNSPDTPQNPRANPNLPPPEHSPLVQAPGLEPKHRADSEQHTDVRGAAPQRAASARALAGLGLAGGGGGGRRGGEVGGHGVYGVGGGFGGYYFGDGGGGGLCFLLASGRDVRGGCFN